MSDRITAAEAATLAGVRPRTWSSYVARKQAPAPVQHIGRTPLWDRQQVKAWLVSRPGRGARTDLA